MAEKAHPNEGGVRVNPVDRRGRVINPAVLNAAEEIGRRALRHAERQLIDPAVAANLLEEAAATVSRAMSAKAISQPPIKDLQSYLFRAFLRRVNKKHKRELSLADSLRIHAREVPNSVDPRTSIENKILIDEFLMQCDPTTRDMLWRRIVGFSWKEIGWSYRISSHAAESKFNQAFQKARRRLGLR
jgi:DNA-directed RNA polymerase specialized sigma24 family protein